MIPVIRSVLIDLLTFKKKKKKIERRFIVFIDHDFEEKRKIYYFVR